MILTNRDKEVIAFLEEFKIATTNTISDIFYPCLRVAQHRLKLMYNDQLIKRDRDSYTSQFYYYIKKPRQLRHSLLLTDFYRELNKIAKIELFKVEFSIEDIRADGFVAYEYRGKKDIAFIEVEISNKGFDIAKYEKLYRSGKLSKYNFPKFPLVIVITDKRVPESKLKVIQVNEDMKNLKEALA